VTPVPNPQQHEQNTLEPPTEGTGELDGSETRIIGVEVRSVPINEMEAQNLKKQNVPKIPVGRASELDWE